MNEQLTDARRGTYTNFYIEHYKDKSEIPDNPCQDC